MVKKAVMVLVFASFVGLLAVPLKFSCFAGPLSDECWDHWICYASDGSYDEGVIYLCEE